MCRYSVMLKDFGCCMAKAFQGYYRMFPDRVRRSLDGWYVVAKRLDYSANFLF